MYNRQGILTRKGKRSGNPKNRESQVKKIIKEKNRMFNSGKNSTI